ncbi:MAG TPA: NeuD/PglB/VioB family sugar acetyltransferase [Microbacteriaceae bacterium]|nr:NeuD/PglB/VioB family sugar acetyltransferase [Microbacteriaceae bacterium]
MTDVLLIGASGLAREILAAGMTGVVGILDDDTDRHGSMVAGVPILGSVASAAGRPEKFLLSIGPGAARRKVAAILASLGIVDDRFATFVAPGARVGATSVVGTGSVLLDGVVVTADAVIGRHVVIMPNCTITHDDVLADFTTLAAAVSLGGSVRTGEGAYIGMNAAIRQGVVVGSDATVGMGAVVLRDIPAAQTWAGIPARELGEAE